MNSGFQLIWCINYSYNKTIGNYIQGLRGLGVDTMDNSGTKYDRPRKWIQDRFQDGKTLEFICDKSEEWLNNRAEEDGWPDNPASYWKGLVEEAWKWHTSRLDVIEIIKRSTLHGKDEVNGLNVPSCNDSCWQLYRKKIEHFDNVETIEVECLNILNYLSTDTTGRVPVKGLVAGYVQSGKTANMAGLIAMAADSGWNVFIVLSGTIDSLRKQTQTRLYHDLNSEGCRLHWNTLEHINPDYPDQSPTKFDFSSSSTDRYLAVCLKNKTRLTNLLRWFNANQKKKEQMRVLVIDDEADQASINTARTGAKRKAINDLLIKIVEGRDENGNVTSPYAAMNYISYTATPYANFLSEGSPESLYPRNFVTLLTPSNRYLGPVQLFGAPNRDLDGLGVIGFPGDKNSKYGIVDVTEDTDYAMCKFHDGDSQEMPSSLRDAVCWFLCCAGVLRNRAHRKPVSLLVHTSMVTDDHKIVANAVASYLDGNADRIVDDCRAVYNAKTEQFPKEFFLQRCKGYADDSSKIDDYPDFESIEPTIRGYLTEGLKHITLNKAKKRIQFCNGIHLCIDNCKNYSVEDIVDPSEDENLIPRLVYPDSEQIEDLEPAPAFIVVGGNTLSRGLTIEGLVSTYFARRVSQGDTLMQMGRWFGYRIGYELLPRMWMSARSYQSFEKLIEVDEAMRDFIRENYDYCTPEDFPVLVKTFPKTGYLTSMTAPNKSHAAVKTGYNFEGTTIETTSICVEPDVLRANLQLTTEFIGSLGLPDDCEGSPSLVWRNIDSEKIFNGLLSGFKYSVKAKSFQEISELKKWADKKSSSGWNVILAGVQSSKYGTWRISESITVNKVARSAVRSYDDPETKDKLQMINIKSLSSPIDRIADVKIDMSNPEQIAEFNSMKEKPDRTWRAIRNKFGLEGVPALIIYCISKESPASDGREPIDTEEDVIGLTVIMPGSKSSKSRAGYIQIPVAEVRGE